MTNVVLDTDFMPTRKTLYKAEREGTKDNYFPNFGKAEGVSILGKAAFSKQSKSGKVVNFSFEPCINSAEKIFQHSYLFYRLCSLLFFRWKFLFDVDY